MSYLYEENPRRRRRARRRRAARGRRRSRSRRPNPFAGNPGNPRRRRRSRRRSARRRGGRRRNPTLLGRASGLLGPVAPAATLFATQWVGEFLTSSIQRLMWGNSGQGPRFGYLQMAVGVLGGMLANSLRFTRPYSRQFAASNLAFGFYNAFVLPTGADAARKIVPAKSLLSTSGASQISDWIPAGYLGESELYGGLGDFATSYAR